MSAAIPGDTASTFLVHFFDGGLADERYVVERFKAFADGDIRPWLGEAPAATKEGPSQGEARHCHPGGGEEMRPARTEITVCTGTRTRGGQQLWGDLAASLWHDRR